ncbi:hypothetical protein Hanom_Chr12g01118171 [Helianthus anomalus]
MRDVQSLMKRMHYNVAGLAQVDIQELTVPIPKEASQLEVPKIIRKKPSATPASQTGPSSMGPPLAVSKEDMLKRFESIPKVITNLNISTPQTQPRQTTSGETVFTQNLTLKEKRKWADSSTSSSKDQA